MQKQRRQNNDKDARQRVIKKKIKTHKNKTEKNTNYCILSRRKMPKRSKEQKRLCER